MNLLARALGLLVVVFWTTDSYAAESKPNWQAEWERTVQAAKKEGSLSLYLFQGEGELGTVVQLFQKKYPEINVVTTFGRGNTLAPRVMAERRAGKYLVDVYISGVTTAYEVFYRAKILDSVRAALILPEVIDESKWWLGQHQYVDPENRYILLYLGNVGEYVSYNTKAVEGSEIRSYWDFLQPKWKGKILSRDPKISGSQRIGLRMYYHTSELGAEFIRRLYGEMDVTLTQEIRQATDWLANGKFAICFFCSEILKVRAQGLAVDEFRTAKWKASRRTRTPRARSSTGCSRARVRRRFSVSPTRLTILKSRCARISQRIWCVAKCGASTGSNIYWWISRSTWTWRRSKTLSRRLWRRGKRSRGNPRGCPFGGQAQGRAPYKKKHGGC
jgi:hypothetical protein